METMRDWIRRTGGIGRDKVPKDNSRSIWPPRWPSMDSEKGNCLLCNSPNTDGLESAKDFICFYCVQNLIAAEQSVLRETYEKINNYGYQRRAKAIELFLTPEGLYEQRKPIPKHRRRHPDRKRIVRTIGYKEKRIGRSKVPA